MKQILARSEHCLGCKSCELACAVAHSTSKTLFEAIKELKPPQKRIFVESSGGLNFPLISLPPKNNHLLIITANNY